MDTLLIGAIVVIALIVIGAFFVMKYAASKSGGNDNVWKPGDHNHPNPEG